MLISIITPTLNCREYLVQCLQSVLSQGHSPIEHILVDGGSTDGTLDILRRYSQEYPQRIKLITGRDAGPGEAWNKGLAAATGEIMGWLGSDDTYEPDAIKSVAGFFEDHPDASFVYGGHNIINENGRVLIASLPEAFEFDTLLNKKQMIPTTSAFYKKRVIETVGNVTHIIGNDLDLFLKIAKVFPVDRMEKILSNLRVHTKSQTTGSNIQRRKIGLKAWCGTSRCHGGRFFSVYCTKYYIFSVFGWALPIWNFIYYLVLRRFGKKIL